MPAQYTDLKDKHVLVTGGASGIGQAVANAFAMQASRVSVVDLQDIAAQAHDAITCYQADLTDEVALENALTAATTDQGPVDILINNAAFDPRHATTEMTANQWDDLFALNVRHYFLTSRFVLPSMIQRKQGSIIMVSSIQHFIARSPMAAYTATKSAIIGMVRSLGHEVGKHHVRVNAIAPGWVMTKRQLDDWVTPEIKDKLVNQWQALPKLLEPEDITPTFLFLASDSAAAITRQTILVDGGWMFT